MRQQNPERLGYTKKDRMKNIYYIISEALLQQQRGFVILVSVISPYVQMRKYAREKIKGFVEIFVRCPLAVCEARDVKGMYRLAREGKIRYFTGLSDPYEEPVNAEIVVDTEFLTVEGSAKKVIAYLENRKYVEKILYRDLH